MDSFVEIMGINKGMPLYFTVLYYLSFDSVWHLDKGSTFICEMVIADDGARMYKQEDNMMMNRQSGRWTGLYFASWLTLFSWCRLHFKLRDLYLFKAPFSSLCLTESLIFLSFIHKPQDTLVLSNPSHHCPFISPPAEFIILDFVIPPSPLQLIVFCALKDRGPSILSQYLRHYVFPSINFFLALPLSPYPLPSLAVH